MDGYRIGWDTGPEKLLLVSVGTGRANPEVSKKEITAAHAVSALVSLMDDCASLQELLMQWISSSRTARSIDGELGDLRNDLLAGAPLLTYLRYNVDMSKYGVQNLDPGLTDSGEIESLSSVDAPENMQLLHSLGTKAGERDIKDQDFPAVFDLL